MQHAQPSPSAPRRLASGMRTSVRKVSLNSLAPEIWRIGRVSIPGVFISTTKKVSPLCLGTVGSVRTTRIPQSVRCAQLDQTFCPLTIQSPLPSSARDALVRSPARSEPAAGSEKSRSEEHTSELQSLMRISYAVFCLKKKK